MAETDSGGSSSSSSSYRYRSASASASASASKMQMMKVVDEIEPISGSEFVDAASPSSSSLNKLSSVGCSKLELVLHNETECQRKKYCMPCIGKWVSDVSEMENFNVSNLITYLRTEFQSVHFKITEEKLRVLEEEGDIHSKETMIHVESLENELRAVRDKCSELSLKLWKSESSKTDVEVDLKNCKVACHELREKLGKLEKALADKDKELVQLKTSYRDFEDFKKPEKEILELELEPDICLNHYLQQFRNASKVKVEEKLKGKPKSKALVEIEASDSLRRRKRSRISLDGEMKKKNKTNVKSKDNKDTEEGLAAKSESLEEKTKKKKKKKKSNCEALGKHGLETKEGAVGEAVEATVEFLDTPCNEKSSCEILGAKMDKGVSSTKVNSPGTGSCHQCKRVDRGKIFSCTNCKRRYCLLCIQKRYPQLSHGEIEKSCPACQGICNCSACLRKSGKCKAKRGSKQHGT